MKKLKKGNYQINVYQEDAAVPEAHPGPRRESGDDLSAVSQRQPGVKDRRGRDHAGKRHQPGKINMYQKMILLFWPRNTMKVAYLQWQAQEDRLTNARRRLEDQYLATRRLAGRVLTEAHQGILQTARVMLDQPLAPGTLRVQGRLQRAFALRGQGLWRRTPSPLQVKLRRYATGIRELCRTYGEKETRLRWAQEIIEAFTGNPEFCQARFIRLTLISPESARLLFHLRHQRLQNRQENLSEDFSISNHAGQPGSMQMSP